VCEREGAREVRFSIGEIGSPVSPPYLRRPERVSDFFFFFFNSEKEDTWVIRVSAAYQSIAILQTFYTRIRRVLAYRCFVGRNYPTIDLVLSFVSRATIS
jgi:hypothetical protein